MLSSVLHALDPSTSPQDTCLYFQYPFIILHIQKKHSVIFMYMLFHSVGIYLPTSYVQDTVLGAVKIGNESKRGPCSCRTYVLVGGDKQFGNWSIHLSASRKGISQFIY